MESTDIYVKLDPDQDQGNQRRVHTVEEREYMEGMRNVCSWFVFLVEMVVLFLAITVAFTEHQYMKQILQSDLPILVMPRDNHIKHFGPDVMNRLKHAVHGPEDNISNKMQSMCSSIFPREWSNEWKAEPDFWTETMRDNFDFCHRIYK